MSNSVTMKNAAGQSSDLSSTIVSDSKDHLFTSQSKQRVSSSSGMSQLSRSNSRRQQQQAQQQQQSNKADKILEQDETKINVPMPKPSSYCVNINQDGAMSMDRVSHLNAEQIQMETLEHSLRPISGMCHFTTSTSLVLV